MILMINKWHNTNGVEVASSVKVEKPTDVECYREAKKQVYQLAANYMADNTVHNWTLCIYDPKSCKIVEPMQYFMPVVQVNDNEEPSA